MTHSANCRFIGVFHHEKIAFVNNASVLWFENWRYRKQIVSKKKKKSILFPQIFRIFYYSEFLVLELKSRRNKFMTTVSGELCREKSSSGKTIVSEERQNFKKCLFSLTKTFPCFKSCHFFPSNKILYTSKQ